LSVAAILRAPPLLPLHIILVQRHGQHRIVPQLVVIVEILVAQRQPKHALRDEVQQRMLDLLGVAVVGEAGGEAPYDSRARLQFLQQQGSPIGGDVAPIEAPNQFASPQRLRICQWLVEGVESFRRREWRDYQSHADTDAGRHAKVTSFGKNVL
jgi:hypothetical protein